MTQQAIAQIIFDQFKYILRSELNEQDQMKMAIQAANKIKETTYATIR